jgi:phospholipid/cholesterol/gamma-HCH transport system substrate-binding protein
MGRARALPKRMHMDRDANYVAVGAFVLLVIAMALSFVLWYTNQKDKHIYLRYEIYFPGTVSGLTPGSSVRYLGVDVGKVARILIDPQQHNRVLVIADIEATAPIDGRTRASLSLQGITGLLFIDLKQDGNSTAVGPLADGLHYPVIRSAPSDFDVLLSNLPQLTTHLVELVDRVNQVFSDENVRSFKVTLDNARLASERLPGTLREVQELVTDARGTFQEVKGAAADLRAIEAQAAPDLESAIANMRHVSDKLAKTSDLLERFVTDNEPVVTRFTHQSLPEFEQLLRESRQAARDFRDLSRSLKQNPSQLIYEPNYRGVEVAK